MERTSRGIILEPDPRYKEKRHFLFKIFRFICSWGTLICWGIFAILMILRLLRWITIIPDSKILSFIIGTDIIFFVFAICLLPLFWLWDETKRCPYCGHFFTMERISENKVVDTENRSISRNVYDTSNSYVSDLYGNHAYITKTTQSKEHGVETTKTYTYNMKCTRCECVNKVMDSKTSQHF